MKYFLLLGALFTLNYASIDTINSFEADFTQEITDEKSKVLSYKGHILASKPQFAKWIYQNPVHKYVYINQNSITIVEPEIEQVIIKHIDSNFNFFHMIKNAKEIDKNTYLAYHQGSKFTITTEDKLLKSISYLDEFDNSVKIIFKNQEQNKIIDEELFRPNIPIEFDIINN